MPGIPSAHHVSSVPRGGAGRRLCKAGRALRDLAPQGSFQPLYLPRSRCNLSAFEQRNSGAVNTSEPSQSVLRNGRKVAQIPYVCHFFHVLRAIILWLTAHPIKGIVPNSMPSPLNRFRRPTSEHREEWWQGVTVREKRQAIRVLNRETPSLGPVNLPAIPKWRRWRERQSQRLPMPSVDLQLQHEARILSTRRARLETVMQWRATGILPQDVRRCKYAPCSRFFLAPKHRPGKVYDSDRCGRNFRSAKCMNTKLAAVRACKLARVRRAKKAFRGMPDWKERTARRAGVTRNFVSYAVARGEIKAND